MILSLLFFCEQLYIYKNSKHKNESRPVGLFIVYDSFFNQIFLLNVKNRSILLSSIMEIAYELVDSSSYLPENEIGMLVIGRDSLPSVKGFVEDFVNAYSVVLIHSYVAINSTESSSHDFITNTKYSFTTQANTTTYSLFPFLLTIDMTYTDPSK